MSEIWGIDQEAMKKWNDAVRLQLDKEFEDKCAEYEECLHEKDRENKDLKRQIAEMKEQLDKAIVPKFKVGQEVFSIGYEKIKMFRIDCGVLLEDYIQYNLLDETDGSVWVRNEHDILATREEAEQRLKQLKGE